MAILVLDDTCPLCGGQLFEGQDAYSAFGLFTTGDLANYCVRPMHWSCYLAWPHQPRFAALAATAWRTHVAENPQAHRVLDRPEVLVSLTIDHAAQGEVSVFLNILGYDLRVAVEDWDAWLRFPPQGPHPAVIAAWQAVSGPIRAALPSTAMIRGNYHPVPIDGDWQPLGDGAVFSTTVKEQRWREVCQLQSEGLDRAHMRRLIEFVGHYPDDQRAADGLRDQRPWVDKYLFEPRPLVAHRERGLLWVLNGGWPPPGDPAIRRAAKAFCLSVIAEFPDTRAAHQAHRLMAKWGLDRDSP